MKYIQSKIKNVEKQKLTLSFNDVVLPKKSNVCNNITMQLNHEIQKYIQYLVIKLFNHNLIALRQNQLGEVHL